MSASRTINTYEGVPCKKSGHTERFVSGGACVACSRLSSRSRRPTLEKERAAQMKYRYGVIYDDYLIMLEEQDQSCAICYTVFDPSSRGTSACVDHCHSTGKVRGILCGTCNTGIGLLKDNPDILKSAAEYLQPHKE